jgi:hypothetical protein
MFTRSALVLAFLATVVVGIFALAAPPAPVFLLVAVAAVGTMGMEYVPKALSAAPAYSSADHEMVGGSVDPAGGIGSAARRRLRTVPPIKLAAPLGLR